MTVSKEVPVFVLCGGLGTRLKEETGLKPKPMVPIGNQPIVLHIMRHYARHGFKRFVLCLGYKADVVKSYFMNYSSMNSDFTVKLGSNETTIHSIDHGLDWEVTLAFTGELAMTGSRIAQATAKHLGGAEHFAVTYGDGLTDVDLSKEFAFHQAHDKIGTVMGVNPPSRFGEFKLEGDSVVEFEEKPSFDDRWINGGFFFFRKGFADYLSTDESCILERAPLGKLARNKQLAVYKHEGYWACMDTQRDYEELNKIWDSGKAPWAI